MAGAAGQAAGLAVGAAVGSFVPGVGTFAGGAIGGALGGTYSSIKNNSAQAKLERETLKLNQAQFHARADEQAAIHAATFRQSLAHQVALAGMRGGSGSIAAQFGSQAYKTFLEDQNAIQSGKQIADVQVSLTGADITARKDASNTLAIGRAISAFDGLNLNLPRQKRI